MEIIDLFHISYDEFHVEIYTELIGKDLKSQLGFSLWAKTRLRFSPLADSMQRLRDTFVNIHYGTTRINR